MYIVLFKDGAMMPVAHEPLKEAHQKGARFFYVRDNLTMLELSEWYAMGHPSEFNNKTSIVELP